MSKKRALSPFKEQDPEELAKGLVSGGDWQDSFPLREIDEKGVIRKFFIKEVQYNPHVKQDRLQEGYALVWKEKSTVSKPSISHPDNLTRHILTKTLTTREEKYVKLEKLSVESYNPCFVASAVYKDAFAPEVEMLREFRKNILSQTSPGRLFIKFYYSGTGKKTADFVKDQLPTLGVPVIKKGLDALVKVYSKYQR